MKIFKCFSHNASIAQEQEERTTGRSSNLKFKNKKRRAMAIENRAPTPQSARRHASVRYVIPNVENTPPSAHRNEPTNRDSTFVIFDDRMIESLQTSPELASFEEVASLQVTGSLSPRNIRNGGIRSTCNESITDYLPSNEKYSPMQDSSEDSSNIDLSTATYSISALRSCVNPSSTQTYSSYTYVSTPSSYFENDNKDSAATSSTLCDTDSQVDSSTETVNKGFSISPQSRAVKSQKFFDRLAHRSLSWTTVNSLPATICVGREAIQGNKCTQIRDFRHLTEARFNGVTISDTFLPVKTAPFSPNNVEYFNRNVMKVSDLRDSTVDYDTEFYEETLSTETTEFVDTVSFGPENSLEQDHDCYQMEETASTDHTLSSYRSLRLQQLNTSHIRLLITVTRGRDGFGFSFVGEFPPRVGTVERGSPAEQAGVQKEDLILMINGQDVLRSTSRQAAHMVKKMDLQFLIIGLQRDCTINTSVEVCTAGYQHSHKLSSHNRRGIGTSTDSLQEKSSDDRYKGDILMAAASESCEYESMADDSSMYSQPSQSDVTDSAGPVVERGHKMNAPNDVLTSVLLNKHECIHRLMSLEQSYIDYMNLGMERYSRPLRHCILNRQQYTTVFQNVEKLVTISEYNLKQLQDRISSAEIDIDESQPNEHSLFQYLPALAYQTKIQMLCQAYGNYAKGLDQSNLLLRDMKKNEAFVNFIKDPRYGSGQRHLSVSDFINRPVLHFQDLYTIISEMFASTPKHSPDFINLKQMVDTLSSSLERMTDLIHVGGAEDGTSLTSAPVSDKASPVNSTLAISVRSIDKDIIQIQDMLVFAPSVQDVQLWQGKRHLIYQGEIYRCNEKGSWSKYQLFLFSDLMLMARARSDGSLYVTDRPISIHDLAALELHRKHPSEFVLHLAATSIRIFSERLSPLACSGGNVQPITLRAASSQEKFLWKSLLEHRVSAVTGNKLQYFSQKGNTTQL